MTTTMTGPMIDPALATRAASLRARAVSLRTQADALPDVLAAAYRRRAAELELSAWALDAHAGVRYDTEADLPHAA